MSNKVKNDMRVYDVLLIIFLSLGIILQLYWIVQLFRRPQYRVIRT